MGTGRTRALAVVAICALSRLLPAQGQDAGAFPEGWELVWSDEFDGTAVDPTKWTFDEGRWGRVELQCYDRDNAWVEDGNLVIEAREETCLGKAYTSARVKTEGLHDWTYGRVEARVQIPAGNGLWPAFWMLGSNIGTVGWPACGEIDIMENIGREPTITHCAIHGPGYTGAESIGSFKDLGEGSNLSADFHLFAMEWSAGRIEWFLDGASFFVATPDAVWPDTWVFDGHPFFIVLNVAIGGDWAGPPDAATVFPQRMLVDYVRVYQLADEPPPPPPQGSLHVADIAMAANQTGRTWQAVAVVSVVDEDGQAVEGAAVTCAWSGLVQGGMTEATTLATGQTAPIYSTKTKQSGTIGFTVIGIAKPGYTYYPDANVETSDRISR